MFNIVRVDPVPLTDDDFSAVFQRWLTTLVDSLNEEFQQLEDNITELENRINTELVAPSLTNAQLALISAAAPNGSIWYVTDAAPPTLVFKMNNVLVKPTTTAYP